MDKENDISFLLRKSIMESKLDDYDEEKMIEQLITLKHLYSIGFRGIDYDVIVPGMLYRIFDNWHPVLYYDNFDLTYTDVPNSLGIWSEENSVLLAYTIKSYDNFCQIIVGLDYDFDDFNEAIKSRFMELLLSTSTKDSPFLKTIVDIMTSRVVNKVDIEDKSKLIIASKNILF